MSYKSISEEILKNIGGKSNVQHVIHCATRLRFTLKDSSLVDEEALKHMKKLLGTMDNGGEYQIIIGNDVNKYYDEIVKMEGIQSEDTIHNKENVLNKIMNYISGTMFPLMSALIGSSVLKGVLSLLVVVGFLAEGDSTYAILSGASNAVFYFLPILAAFSAAKKLGVNQFVAACIGGALMEPNIVALMENTGDVVNFFGIPVVMFSYASSLFPALLAIWLYSYAEKWLEKVVPKNLKLIVIPFVGLIVFVPMTLIVFGPFAVYVANGISALYELVYQLNPIITGALVGSLFPFLVVFGLHWAVMPIIINDFAAMGVSSLYGLWFAANLAQWSIPFGVAIGTKNANERNVAFSNIFTVLFSGATEPVMFGYVLQNKRFIFPMVTAGAIGGALLGVFNTVSTGFIFLNIFTLPFVKSNGSTMLFVGLALIELIIGALLTKFYVYARKSQTP